jgi:hypothetical protein
MQTEQSFLSYQLSDIFQDPLFRDFALSFRTTQPHALLLYAHDHMNNFIQLEIRKREELVLTYNSMYEIKEVVVSVPGEIEIYFLLKPQFKQMTYKNFGSWNLANLSYYRTR